MVMGLLVVPVPEAPPLQFVNVYNIEPSVIAALDIVAKAVVPASYHPVPVVVPCAELTARYHCSFQLKVMV